ncbi:MAG TPA: hypothetical protein VMB85_27750 [Bryobacteraceae bacterium]|nr:hypothetical protein [Bryobacteraceae bacterium]
MSGHPRRSGFSGFSAACYGLLLFLSAAMAQPSPGQFPLWERLLRYYGGKTDATPVPSMKMGNHMQMSLKRKPQPGDEQRARGIVEAARRVVAHYADVNLALRDGYKPFHPTGKMGEEVHYTSYRYHRLEQRRVDYDHPGSILYKRTPRGMQAVGVMYTAPQDSTADQLNIIAPLSIATWHRHVDFCGGPRNLPFAEQFGPHAAFGPQGSIHSEDACRKAAGLWIPVVFGWMTHVYPNAQPPAEVWAGMDMQMDANTDDQIRK